METRGPSANLDLDLTALKPRDLWGWFYVALASCLTSLAIYLSSRSSLAAWIGGQVLLSFALLQWFALLHEAGHKTLFRTPLLNKLWGHAAGFWALIPFDCWKLIHARHHYWTGWQDLDATTATLAPRPLGSLERAIVIVCWWTWIPLFSTLYRLHNYWNLPRLCGYFPQFSQRARLTVNIVAYLALYGALIVWIGPQRMLELVGPALLLTLMMQDLLILSQHTHIPMELSTSSGDAVVSPFAPSEQEVFTRSLTFPSWFARWILVNLDAHELHHVHPSVPGYYLHTIRRPTLNAVPWWRWLLRAKCVRGDVLLFQNRNVSGYEL